MTGQTICPVLEHLQAFLTPARRRRIEEVLRSRTRHLTVVLENLYHEHNISAVFRSCDAFGVQDVHVIDRSATFRVTRDIALGTHRWLTLHCYQGQDDRGCGDPAAQCLSRLRNRGYRIVAAVPDAEARPLRTLDVSQPAAIVIGHEKWGVSEQLRAAADELVTIPMCGFVDSLNASVVAAVCLHDLTSRLRQSGLAWQLTSAEQDELRLQWTRQSVRQSQEIERRFLQSVREGKG